MTNEQALDKISSIFGGEGFCSFDNSEWKNDGKGYYFVCSEEGPEEGAGSSWEEAFEDMYKNFPKRKRI